MTAKVHQEYGPSCSYRRMRTRSRSDDGAHRFMPGCHRRSVKKLRPFRAAKGVSTDAEQEFAGARYWHCFFLEINFFVPHKMGNPATRGYGGGHPLSGGVENQGVMKTLESDNHVLSGTFQVDLRLPF